MPDNFKEDWCVWGNDVPTDIWLEGDIRRDQKMPPTWVVWSDRFAVSGSKPIVALTQDGQTIGCGLFYILDRKAFVLNDRWMLRAVLGTAGQEIDELAKLTAWDLSDLVDAYSHMAGRWTRQQDGNCLLFSEDDDDQECGVFHYPGDELARDEVVEAWYSAYGLNLFCSLDNF